MLFLPNANKTMPIVLEKERLRFAKRRRSFWKKTAVVFFVFLCTACRNRLILGLSVNKFVETSAVFTKNQKKVPFFLL